MARIRLTINEFIDLLKLKKPEYVFTEADSNWFSKPIFYIWIELESRILVRMTNLSEYLNVLATIMEADIDVIAVKNKYDS